MDIKEIYEKHKELEQKLNKLLCTMEYNKSGIADISTEIIKLQDQCPHAGIAGFTLVSLDGFCPYCGAKLEEPRND